MKIVHLSHLYHPSEGGVQFFFKNISERLVRDYGDEVTVVTTNSLYGPERKIFKKVSPAEENINGVKVLRFPYRRWHHKIFPLVYKVLGKLSISKPEWMVKQSFGPYSPSMKKYLLQVEADAFCGSSSNYYYMQLPLWKKCNFFYFGSIHLEHDISKQQLLQTQLESIKASTLYLANTLYEKNCMIRLGVPKEKVLVLGVGVDIDELQAKEHDVKAFRNELKIASDDILIGYVGRIERTKNVQVLVKSFEKVAAQHAKAHLLIAGSGNVHIQELVAIINHFSEDIKSRIHWRVNFQATKKAVIFNALDIFVLPSNNESFGIVFLEAWSCKKPVIGAAIGAVKDVVTENSDGLLMEMNSEESLSDKISLLIDNPERRNQMGENGYTKVKENYTWDIITARLRKCYQKGNNTAASNTLKKAVNV